MRALVFHVARPITLWALHFIAVYALISAACAPRELLDIDVMRMVAFAVTFAAALVALVWVLAARRRLSRLGADAPDRPLALAAVWSAAISLLAIIANTVPIVFLGSCAG